MPDKPHVILYTRQGCHLCEEARREMALSGCAGRYTYEEVDILSDAELNRRYGWDIPVVTIDGTHAFKHRLDARDFRRAVERASKARMKGER